MPQEWNYGRPSGRCNVVPPELRFLLVEAAQVTVRCDPEWHGKFFHLAMRRGRKIGKVPVARRLAVRLYWMWRKGLDSEQMKKFGSHAGQPGHRQGAKVVRQFPSRQRDFTVVKRLCNCDDHAPRFRRTLDQLMSACYLIQRNNFGNV
jgi:hypothetical protein